MVIQIELILAEFKVVSLVVGKDQQCVVIDAVRVLRGGRLEVVLKVFDHGLARLRLGPDLVDVGGGDYERIGL